MDPFQLQQLMQMLRQRMMGGGMMHPMRQMPPMGGQMPGQMQPLGQQMQPMGRLPGYGGQQPDGQLPAIGGQMTPGAPAPMRQQLPSFAPMQHPLLGAFNPYSFGGR